MLPQFLSASLQVREFRISVLWQWGAVVLTLRSPDRGVGATVENAGFVCLSEDMVRSFRTLGSLTWSPQRPFEAKVASPA